MECAICFVAGGGRVVVDAGEAIDLQIDPAGRKVDSIVGVGESRGSTPLIKLSKEISIVLAGGKIDAATFHSACRFIHKFPTGLWSAKCKTMHQKKVVEKGVTKHKISLALRANALLKQNA